MAAVRSDRHWPTLKTEKRVPGRVLFSFPLYKKTQRVYTDSGKEKVSMNMELREKKIQSEAIFDGQVLHVRRDTVELPDGHPATREHILHVGAVAVLALTDTNEVILERQYRYPFHDILTEIPAGKLNSREEDPLSAAKRELAEETGIHAKKWRRLGDFYGSPAILGERLQLFLAEDLSRGQTHTDEDEFLEVFQMPLTELVAKVLAGDIPDGKTQVAALRVFEILRREGRFSATEV